MAEGHCIGLVWQDLGLAVFGEVDGCLRIVPVLADWLDGGTLRERTEVRWMERGASDRYRSGGQAAMERPIKIVSTSIEHTL